jgi:hypothetical protein
MGSKLLGVLRKTLRWFSTGQMFKTLIINKIDFLNGKRKENEKTDGNGKQKQEQGLEREWGREGERGRERETGSTQATSGTPY